MHEIPPTTPRPGRPSLDALLYLSGELDAARAAEFEASLEHDPHAQEQLAHAVQLHALLTNSPTVPDPGYRDAVRQRVLTPQPSATVTPAPQSPRLLRRWVLTLTASVTLTAGLLTEPRPLQLPEAEESPLATSLVSGPPEASAEVARSETEERIDMAEVWAEMSGVEHYQQLSDEDQRRRNRVRDAGHLVLPSLLSERAGGGNLD